MFAAGNATSAIFLTIAVLASATDAFAGFERRYIGARAIGSSGGLTVFGDDPWSFYYNPARTAEVSGVNLFYSPAFMGMPEVKSTGISYRGKVMTLDCGAGLHTFGLDSYRETVATLNISSPVSDFLFAGINANLNHLYILNYGTDLTVSLDAGLRTYFSENLAAGFAVTNLNSASMTYSRDRLPQSLAGGVAYMSDRVNIGVDYFKELGFPSSVRVAAEYTPVDFVTFRTGTLSGTGSFSAGFSARISRFVMEYGAVFHDVLGTTHMFGISIILGGGGESEYARGRRYREELRSRRGD